jgi:hypothetical protein
VGWLERAFTIVLGVIFMVGSFQKPLYLGGAFQRRGPWTHVATPVGRVCIFVGGAACVFVGATGITEFWHFGK